MLTTIVTTVVGALCIAAVFAALKSRWLYVIAPRLYLNTPLSDGQIVSLTVTNVGLLAEEDVALTMRPGCKFELIATSKSTLAVSGKTLSIPKLARAESVNILLLVEGKSFEQSDIDSIESKAAKGKVVESKEKATALWQSIIALPIAGAVLFVPFVFGTIVGSETQTSAVQYLDAKLELFGQSKQLSGYKNELTEKYALMSGVLSGATKDRRIAIEVQEIVRRGDVLSVVVKISNNTKMVVLAEANLESASGGRGPLDWTDSRSDGFALAPAESRSLRLRVYVPERDSVKLVQGRYSFKVPGGDELMVSQILTF
jgi:hypothetical protein